MTTARALVAGDVEHGFDTESDDRTEEIAHVWATLVWLGAINAALHGEPERSTTTDPRSRLQFAVCGSRTMNHGTICGRGKPSSSLRPSALPRATLS